MPIVRVPANSPPPPIRWWGNVFYRVWKGWEQLVVVVRLPWWRERRATEHGYSMPWMVSEQLVVSWRRREGWRYGWRVA